MLHLHKELFAYQSWMKAIKNRIISIIFGSFDPFFDYAVFHTLDLLAPPPANLPHINRVRNDIGNRRIAPQITMPGRDMLVVQVIGDQLCTLPLRKHPEYFLNCFSLSGLRLQGKSLLILQLDTSIPIRCNAADIFSLGCRTVASPHQTAVDRFCTRGGS